MARDSRQMNESLRQATSLSLAQIPGDDQTMIESRVLLVAPSHVLLPEVPEYPDPLSPVWHVPCKLCCTWATMSIPWQH